MDSIHSTVMDNTDIVIYYHCIIIVESYILAAVVKTLCQQDLNCDLGVSTVYQIVLPVLRTKFLNLVTTMNCVLSPANL